MPAFRSVVSVLVSFGGRSFSTNSRPALRAAYGRPPARQRHDGHRGTGLTLHGGWNHTRQVVWPDKAQVGPPVATPSVSSGRRWKRERQRTCGNARTWPVPAGLQDGTKRTCHGRPGAHGWAAAGRRTLSMIGLAAVDRRPRSAWFGPSRATIIVCGPLEVLIVPRYKAASSSPPIP